MAKRNVMEALNITPDGKQSLNPFPLSAFTNLHSKSGQLTLCSMRRLGPNEKVRVGVDAATRTKLCNTANFARIKENYYFAFVPDALIYSGAYQMSIDRAEPYSAVTFDITQMPVFNLGAVVYRCIEASLFTKALHPEWYDEMGFNIAPGVIRNLDLMGYGYYGDLLDMVMNNPYRTAEEEGDRISDAVMLAAVKKITDTILFKPSVAAAASYQCFWYHYMRNSIYDNNTNASIFNFDDCMANHLGDAVPTVDEYRGLDSFIIHCLRVRYVQNKKDIFMASMPGSQFGAVSTVQLNTNLTVDMDGVETEFEDNWQYFNGEHIPADLSASIGSTPDGVKKPWNLVSTNLSSDHTARIHHSHYFDTDAQDQPIVHRGVTLFDVLSLVESQAIQKWKQKSMLAGQRTKDQYKAHYGVVPRHLQDHLPDFIGSVDNEIHVKEITSNANTASDVTTQSNLGEIRGRGYGVSDQRTFEFYSTEHGLLLLFKSIVVENTYTSYGIAAENTMIYFSDFMQSEFQNIGLQAVPKYLLNVVDAYGAGGPLPGFGVHPDGANSAFLDDQDNTLCGMAPRYYPYKQAISQVHGLFNPARLYMGKQDDMHFIRPGVTSKFGYSDMESFVIPRGDMIDDSVISFSKVEGVWTSTVTRGAFRFALSKIYQNPHLVDSIFAFDADDNLDTDPFFSDIYFKVDALVPLSTLGLAQF